MQEQAREEIYRGSLISLRIETLPQPSGGTSRFEIVEHPGGVAIVALRENKKTPSDPEVVLVYQRRPAINKSIWEIPAGMVEPSERGHPEWTAVRELREETGYEADSCELLVKQYPAPGFSTETLTICLARVSPDSTASGPETPLDPTEITRVKWMPLSKALALCDNGKMEDGKTLVGLYMAHYRLTNERQSLKTL